MKKLKIISVLLLTLTLNSIVANAAVTTTKNKDGSVTITDTTTGKVTDVINGDGSPVTDEQIAEGIANNARANTSTNTTNSAAVNVLKPVQNGWTQDSNGYWYSYKDGVMQTDWTLINGDWYCFNKNGMMTTSQWIEYNHNDFRHNLYHDSAHSYYVGWDGKLVNGNVEEHEPKYGTVTLEYPLDSQYYNWSNGYITFQYSDSTGWHTTSVTRLFNSNDFGKYAEVLMPTDKAKNGDTRTFELWIYLGVGPS